MFENCRLWQQITSCSSDLLPQNGFVSQVCTFAPREGQRPLNPARKFCVILAFAATGAWAQKPAAAAKPPMPPAAAAKPSTVTFTVEVTNKAGHPVSGLKAADFTLLDDNVPAPIKAFAEHTPGPASPESAVLLIDTVNMQFGGDSIARQQIMNFLRTFHGRLPFPITLTLLTDTGVSELGKTSDDPHVLLATLNSQAGELRDIGRDAGFWGAAEREQTSINGLGLLTQAMSRMPGRKLLIWVGPGWPIFDNPTILYTDKELHQIFAEVVGLSDAMAHAQVTLDQVDPLGTWDAGSFRTFLWEGFTKPLVRWQQALPADLALQVIATQSGGLVLNSSNDVAGEVGTCARDGSVWYTITIPRKGPEKPGTWNTVKLKLDKPGLVVRTRPGYYAAQP